jgi:predicted lipoprotein with Yx(FWY)xxD motif
MKRNQIGILATVIVVVIIVAGYFVLHKSSNNKTPTLTTSTSSRPVSDAIVITKSSSKYGNYLAEPNGTPLYNYGADSKGVSRCTGSCLSIWPAYQDKTSTTNLPNYVGTIKRTDNGEIQYTYNGLPLYTYVGDSQGGTPTGNGVNGFKLAVPLSINQSQSNSTSSSSNSSGY